MSFREWLKRLFERAQPVWEDELADVQPIPVKAKPPRKSKAKKKMSRKTKI